MMRNLKQVLAMGAASVALAGGAALGGAGTALAAPVSHHGVTQSASRVHCVRVPGSWTRMWHPGYRDHRGRWHAGYWTRTWRPAHMVCRRVR